MSLHVVSFYIKVYFVQGLQSEECVECISLQAWFLIALVLI